MSRTTRRDESIGSVEELLAVADALEREAVTRYRGLSTRMSRQGEAAMAAQFDTLAALEERHVDKIADRAQGLLGRPPAALRAGWELPTNYGEDEARGAELSAYQALAFAVRNEERAFAFYVYVAAAAKDSAARALAEDLARDELGEHASILRHRRRRTFHAERPVRVEIPPTLEALRADARRWECEAAAAHAALANALEEAGESEDGAIFRQLAADEQQAAAGEKIGAALPQLHSVADGLRLLEQGFDRYALIAEQSHDESVVAEAQRRASEMVARLARAGGARNNALLGERAR